MKKLTLASAVSAVALLGVVAGGTTATWVDSASLTKSVLKSGDISVTPIDISKHPEQADHPLVKKYLENPENQKINEPGVNVGCPYYGKLSSSVMPVPEAFSPTSDTGNIVLGGGDDIKNPKYLVPVIVDFNGDNIKEVTPVVTYKLNGQQKTGYISSENKNDKLDKITEKGVYIAHLEAGSLEEEEYQSAKISDVKISMIQKRG